MTTRSLSVEAVVGAGAALAREKGFPALGVRALAARLKVTPMALYRHLPDGEALSSAVLDALLLELPALPSAGQPLEQLKAWAVAARAMLQTCRGLAHHLLLHWFELPRALEVVESLLGATEALGFKGFEAVAASNAVFTFVLMRVELEESLRDANVLQRKLPALRGLPRLARNAAEYRVARVDAHFDYGLSLLLEGLERRS
ncbi:MAG TPA: TetR/AcrR family transcriptional regulator C-terminal domain-containing protein [Myxococcales bacterium]|jgi:AcrR family transcriptional regulator|nr:TetR/AcrR family transcriptional regulator C-terminal domain-containing protein [Myxococcales bacterium]